jgi:hypothetical protein
VNRALALAAAATLVLAGCGGGSAGRLSHAEFVKRADALCNESVAKLRALPNPATIPELVVYLEQARPIRTHFLTEARKLRPPAPDEADWRRALAFDEGVLGDYDRMIDAAKRHDRREFARANARLQALPATNPFERRLGLRGC